MGGDPQRYRWLRTLTGFLEPFEAPHPGVDEVKGCRRYSGCQFGRPFSRRSTTLTPVAATLLPVEALAITFHRFPLITERRVTSPAVKAISGFRRNGLETPCCLDWGKNTRRKQLNMFDRANQTRGRLPLRERCIIVSAWHVHNRTRPYVFPPRA